MTGIGGVRMWMEDWFINASSYPKKYQENFIKVKDLWNNCVKDFKACKSIKQCNDTFTKYEDEIESLRNVISIAYEGYKKIPLGIADTLDYFEEAVGDLEDKALTRLIDTGGRFSVVLPEDEGKYIDTVMKNYKSRYLNLDFTKEGSHIKVAGDYLDVRSFIDDFYNYDESVEILDEGVFENA